ncbi:hypothetical protein BV20DRAFT_1118601, partial [Pilatotrama ljubarskyi]
DVVGRTSQPTCNPNNLRRSPNSSIALAHTAPCRSSTKSSSSSPPSSRSPPPRPLPAVKWVRSPTARAVARPARAATS